MPVKPWTGLALSVAVAVSLAACVDEAEARSCAAKGSEVMQAAGAARIYEDDGARFACRPGVRTKLGFPFKSPIGAICEEGVVRMELKPRAVAWHTVSDCRDEQGWTVSVRRLSRTSKTKVFNSGVTTCGDTCPDYGIGPVPKLALDTDGSVGWIAEDASTSGPKVLEVWKSVRGADPERLSRSPDVARRNLHWRNRVLHWREAGEARSG